MTPDRPDRQKQRAPLRVTRRLQQRRRERGFTLIEMMVVLAVLVAVAATAIAVVTEGGDRADDGLVRAEITQVAAAIMRFRRDTGYFPRLGPFGSQDRCVGGTGPTCTDGTIEAVPAIELQSPANLSQLFEEPETNVSGTLIPNMAWNPDTARGWDGPYLETFGEGDVSIGQNIGADAAGVPNGGALQVVAAVADPFDAIPDGTYYEWAEAISGDPVDSRGRPYLFFVDPGAEANLDGCLVPCLLSMGANRIYEAGLGDDIILNLSAAGD